MEKNNKLKFIIITLLTLFLTLALGNTISNGAVVQNNKWYYNRAKDDHTYMMSDEALTDFKNLWINGNATVTYDPHPGYESDYQAYTLHSSNVICIEPNANATNKPGFVLWGIIDINADGETPCTGYPYYKGQKISELVTEKWNARMAYLSYMNRIKAKWSDPKHPNYSMNDIHTKIFQYEYGFVKNYYTSKMPYLSVCYGYKYYWTDFQEEGEAYASFAWERTNKGRTTLKEATPNTKENQQIDGGAKLGPFSFETFIADNYEYKILKDGGTQQEIKVTSVTLTNEKEVNNFKIIVNGKTFGKDDDLKAHIKAGDQFYVEVQDPDIKLGAENGNVGIGKVVFKSTYYLYKARIFIIGPRRKSRKGDTFSRKSTRR